MASQSQGQEGLDSLPKKLSGKGELRRQSGYDPQQIPWSEIFRRHNSILEGHLKMIDKVRKHTVEGSANHQTICSLVDRTRQMLAMSKEVARDFVPDPPYSEKSPLGFSTKSTFLEYSPTAHENAKAVEYSRLASGVKVGGTSEAAGLDYLAKQSPGCKRKTLAQIDTELAINKPIGESDFESRSDAVDAKALGSVNMTDRARVSAMKGSGGEKKPIFVIDTEPTPVNIPGFLAGKTEPTAESLLQNEANTSKRAKKKHKGALPKAMERREEAIVNDVEFEDISAEVDVRMREKEEKRKEWEKLKQKSKPVEGDKSRKTVEGNKAVSKEKKKRKRESAVPNAPVSDNGASEHETKKRRSKISDGPSNSKHTGTRTGDIVDGKRSAKLAGTTVGGEKVNKKLKISPGKGTEDKRNERKRQTMEGDAGRIDVDRKRKRKKERKESTKE